MEDARSNRRRPAKWGVVQAGRTSMLSVAVVLVCGCGYSVKLGKPPTAVESHLYDMQADPRLDRLSMWCETDNNDPKYGLVVLTPSENMTEPVCRAIANDWSKRSANAGFNVTYHVEPLWAGVADLREEIARGKEAETRLAKLLELHGKTEADFPPPDPPEPAKLLPPNVQFDVSDIESDYQRLRKGDN